MYLINQFLLLIQLTSIVTGYLYSGHEFNLMQEYYADSTKNTQLNPSAPQFINQPPLQVTFLNETGLVLPCSVYSQPKSTIKWLQPNAFDVNSYLPYNASSISNTLFNNENGAILRYQRADGSLVFAAHSLLNGQSNNYKSIFQCSATNKFGTTLSRPVKMKAVTLNALEQVIISDVSTFRGNNALFQCNIPTHLENVIKPTGWLISDNTLNTQQSTKLIDSLFIPISTTKGKYIVFDDGNLLIGSVTSEDANRKYSCQLTSALLNHQTKSTNLAKLNLINSINNESIDQQQSNIETNELFNLQIIKQLLRSIDQQNHQNKQIKLNKQVHVLSNKQSANNKIKLYCTANQYPNGPVKWFKQTGQTNLESIAAILDDQTTNHFSLEFDTTILTINNPKLKDTGLYIAIIGNRLQQSNDFSNNIKCAIQLIIREPLKVEINLSKQNSIKQKDLLDSINNLDNNVHNSMQQNSINCTVYGYPVNQIQFYHNGILLDTVLLSSNNNNFKSLTDESPVKSYSLTLNPTYSVIIENGVYQCFAISDYEIETASYTLMQTQEPPKFTNVFKAQILNAGSTLSLSCTATGNPLPTIIWNIDRKPLTTLNNNYLNPNNLLTSHTSNPIQNSARLRFGDFVTKSGNHVTSYVNISNVRPEDGGLYSCVASSLNEQHLSHNQLNNNQDQYVINEQYIRINGKPGIKQMDNFTVLEGADLELYCPTYGNFDARIIWHRLKGNTQTPLPISTRHEIFTNGTLFIRQINRKQDQGFYVCSIEGTESSMSTYVKIIVGPKIEPFSFSKGLEEGMRAVAVCIVSLGDSPLELKWKRNLPNGESSDDLQGAQVEAINSFTSSLTFQSLSKEQAGNYTCIARNAAAVTTHTSELIVNVSPYWIKEPTDQEVIKGHSILLSCAADGNPPPQIRWKRISHNNRNQLSNTRTTITPNSIQKQSNNEIDTTYRTIISNPHMQILENGSLWINSLTAIDEVDFLCQASNNVNPSLSKVIKLIVRSPPSFDRHFETIAVKAGDYLNLPCNVTSGDLPINYKWKRNGIELSNHISNTAQHFHHPTSLNNGNNNQLITLNTEHYQIHLESLNPHQNQFENGLKDQSSTDQETRYWLTLSIAAARRSDSAVFTCLASNKYGNAEKNFRLIVQEKPDPPSSLIVQQITAYSVYLTWASPFSGNSPLLEFRIQCRETEFNGNKQPWTRPNQNLIGEQTNTSTITNNITGCTEYKRSSLENSLTIHNLSSSTGYELRMSARNALGESEFSEQVQFITLEETPTMIPVDLEISALGSKSLKLSWTWPKHLKTEHSTNKQIVKGYNVAYRLVSDSTLENNKNSNNTLQNALQISPSATIVNKRNGQQSTIQPATDSTTDSQNKNQNFIVKSIESSDQDKERFVLLGLRKHSKYEVKVQAYNSAGSGPYSASIFGTTLRYDTPKPPKIISAKPSTNSIELKWTAESEDPIQGYIINYRGEEREWTSEQVPNTNTHIINEIRCGAKYSIYLNAFNEAGRSESSEMVMVKTQGTAPIAPEKSAFLQPNSTSVSLNLHSWVANGCSILYFIVQYREHSSKQWQLISGEIPAETGILVISDINPGEWYNLMVRGVNQAGSTQAEYLFSTLTLDGSTIAPIATFNQDGTDNNQMNNEINSGFRLMNLNVSGTRYLLFQKLNIVLPILCGIAVLSLAAVIVCSYQGKLFTNNICTNDERNQTTGILGNCSTSSASTNNTAINAANLDSSNCLINELTCGLLADQQQNSLICPSITHSQYQPSSNYSECLVHSLNCNEHEYKLCSDVPNLQNLNNINNLNNLNNNLNQQNNNQIIPGEFASINKNNMRSNVGLFRSAFNNSNNNNQSIFPSPYAFSSVRLNTSINEYRTPTIDPNLNRQDRTLNKQQQTSNDNLTLNLNDSLDNTTTTFKLKPIISNQSNDQQSIHNYDAPIFLKRVN